MALTDDAQFGRIEKKLDAIVEWQRLHDLHHARLEGGARSQGNGDNRLVLKLFPLLMDIVKTLAVVIATLLGQRAIT